MRNGNWFSSLALLLCLFSLWACEKRDSAKLGDIAKDFSLQTLEGQQVSLSQFKGKNVFLLFWTQGCVFCQTRNILMVNDIFLEGKKVDLEVLAINIGESKGDVSEFVRQKKLIFPVLLDKDASVSRKNYNVYIVPTLFIIGRDGAIKEKLYGYLTEKALMDFVEPYLRKKD